MHMSHVHSWAVRKCDRADIMHHAIPSMHDATALLVSAYVRPTERPRMHAVASSDASMGFGSPVRRKQADPSTAKNYDVHRVPAEELLGAGFRMTRSSTRYACPPLSHGAGESALET